MNSRRLPLFLGVFLSGIFILVGVAGSCFTVPKILRWKDAASWTKADCEIVSQEVVHSRTAKGGDTIRPRFTWRYTWKDREYTGEGFGTTTITTRDRAYVRKALEKHPIGSTSDLFVNPRDPTQSALEREPVSHIFILFMGPAFILLGLIGAFFTFTGWRGWYAKNTRNPIGRAFRAAFQVFMRPAVMKSFIFGVFALVCALLVAWSFTENGSFIGVAIAAFLAYSLWKAMRPRKSSSRR